MPPENQTIESTESTTGEGATTPATVAPVTTTTPPVTPPSTPATATGARGNVLSGETLTARLAREREAERKRILVEEYGTDKPEEVDRIKKERAKERADLEALRKREESRMRARQTKEEQLAADLKKERERVEALETEIKTGKQQLLVQTQDRIIERVLNEFVKPGREKYIKRDLAEHVKSMAPEALKTFTEAKLKKWLEKHLVDHPEFAKKAAPATTESDASTSTETTVATTMTPKRPITTTKPPSQRTTVVPVVEKRPKDMTKQEWRNHLRSKGIRSVG